MDSSDENDLLSEQKFTGKRTRKLNINDTNIPLWTQKNTDLLIKYRLIRDDLFSSRSVTEGWKAVLSDMQKAECMESFTVGHISKKWANLCRIYKDCKKFLTTSEIPLSYYYIFDNYYSNKQKKRVAPVSKDDIFFNCRLCQQMKGIYKLQEDQNKCCFIQECMSIDVSMDPENFPLTICMLCKSKLDSINIFIKQCRKVDEALHNSTNIDEVKKELSSYCVVLNNIELPPAEQTFTCKVCLVNFKNDLSLTDHEKMHNLDTQNTDESNDVLYYEEVDDLSETDEQNVDRDNVEPTLEEIFLEDDFRSEPSNDEDAVECNNGLVENIDDEVDKQEKVIEIIKKFDNIIKPVSQVYSCIICLKEFNKRGELRRHEKHHKGIKHKCPRADCTKTYSSIGSIKCHELRDHQGITPYLCTLCGKGFIRPSTLKAHERMHKGEKDFACDMCEKKFYTRSNLYIHRRIYHLGYHHFCSQCPRSFVSKSSLDRHEVVHTGIKDFKCTSCESAFYTSRELDWHVKRVHKVEKKFNCGECFKSFHTKYGLTVHTRIHTDERPYPCLWPNCKKRFRVNRKMKLHMKIHTKIKS